VQPSKTEYPIVDITSHLGSVIVAKLVQNEKTLSPSVSSESGSEIVVMLVHRQKAL
jgi:hypothetical protein